MELQFLTLQEALDLHKSRIDKYGGSHGVRDLGLLQSALEMPRATFGGQFLHQDLFAMAAAYLYHIVQNHPFIDGNKRAGLAACIWFLNLNKIEVTTDQDALTEMVLTVAEGKTDKETIANFLRANSAPREG